MIIHVISRVIILFSDRVLQHCAMLLQLHKASPRIWQLGLEFIVINDLFLMPVTCIGLSPLAAGVNSGDTASLAHRGARGPSPGVCDTACANTDLQQQALKLQFPDPLSPQPALLTRLPDFLGGQTGHQGDAGDQLSELSCSSGHFVMPNPALIHLLGFDILFPCCGVIFFQRNT